MKAQPNFRISIPEPCHEDWGKMTPDEKGRFCGVCSKSVVDFTSKSRKEINQFLDQNSCNRICGRFKNSQLAEPPKLKIPFHQLKSSHLSPLRQFAFALLIVFGTTLFSCTYTTGQTVGDVILVDGLVEDERNFVRGKIAIVDKPEIMGDTIAVIEEKRIITCEKPLLGVEEWELLGDIKYMPDDTVVEEEPIGDIDYSRIEIIGEEPMGWITPEVIEDVKKVGQVVAEEIVDTSKIIPEEIIKSIPAIVEEPVNLIKMLTGEEYFEAVEISKAKKVLFITDVEYATVGFMVAEEVELPVETQESTEEIDLEITVTENENTVFEPENSTLKIFPNPSNGQTSISYQIPTEGKFQLDLFDLAGRNVKILVKKQIHYEGTYSGKFDVSILPSGTYICTLQGKKLYQSAKIVVR